jgi:hypothetical protein
VKHRLRGLVIEPLPDLYKELRANYAAYSSVVPLNVGLHSTAKEIPMYRISPEAKNLPDWVKGIASMDPAAPAVYVLRRTRTGKAGAQRMLIRA